MSFLDIFTMTATSAPAALLIAAVGLAFIALGVMRKNA